MYKNILKSISLYIWPMSTFFSEQIVCFFLLRNDVTERAIREVNVQHCYSTRFVAVLHYELHVFCCPVCHTIKGCGTQIKLYNLRAPCKNVPWKKEVRITPGTFFLALCLSFVICVDLNSPKTTKLYNLCSASHC